MTPLMRAAIRVHFVGSVFSVRCSRPSTIASSGFDADVGSGTSPAFSYSTPLCSSSVASPPSSRIMFGPVGSPSAPSGHVIICSVHHQYSSSVSPFQANTGTPCGSSTRAVRADGDGGRGVVLGGEDVAARPAHLGAELDQRLDEHGGLDGHVQRAGDAGAGERLGRAELLAQRLQAGHLVLGEVDLLAAERGEREVGDAEVAVDAGEWAVDMLVPSRAERVVDTGQVPTGTRRAASASWQRSMISPIGAPNGASELSSARTTAETSNR